MLSNTINFSSNAFIPILNNSHKGNSTNDVAYITENMIVVRNWAKGILTEVVVVACV